MNWFRIVLPPLTLSCGLLGALYFYMTRPEPATKEIVNLGELVRVREVELEQATLEVVAQGTVTPARRVVLQAEVSGRITWLNEELVPGGRLESGAQAIRIDARDYRLAAEQQQANVEQAALQLKLERLQQVVAKDEWRIIGEDQNATAEGREMALRGPQLATAQARLASAKSAQSRATLSVGKTGVQVPFNSWVQSENVEKGQLVGPGAALATLIGTDAYWIQVSLPTEQLPVLKIPGVNAGAGEGSSAKIVQQVGDKAVTRSGRVIRLLGDLDPVGRLARVLVEVRDPLGLDSETGRGAQRLPLLLGAYVTVGMGAETLKNVVRLERSALREGKYVYLYSEKGQLEVRPVTIGWRAKEAVYVSSGLAPGDRLITSRLATPVPGMKLRVGEASSDGESGKGLSAAAPSAANGPVSAAPAPTNLRKN